MLLNGVNVVGTGLIRRSDGLVQEEGFTDMFDLGNGATEIEGL